MAKQIKWDKWDKFDKMPEGWKKADEKTVMFTAPKGFIFITNGKTPLEGRKTALLKIDAPKKTSLKNNATMAQTQKAITQRIKRIQSETERLLKESGASKVTKTVSTWKTKGLTYREAQVKAGKSEKKGVLGATFSRRINIPNSPKPKNKKK